MLFFTNLLSHQNHAKVIGEILQYKLLLHLQVAVHPLLEDAKPFVLAKPLEMGQPLHKMVSFDW